MADQILKNQNQNTASNAAQTRQGKETTLKSGAESSAIVKQQRNAENVVGIQQLALNALYKTATAPGTQNKTNVNQSPSNLRNRSNRQERSKAQDKQQSHEQTSTAAEVREQLSIRAAVSRSNNAVAATNRTNQANRNGVTARTPFDGAEEELALQQTLVGQDNIKESSATEIRFGTQTSADSAELANRAQTANDPAQSLDSVALNTSTETLKLLDVVGPEAILTFREKLQQVWVTLDENSTRQLDVIARMPASLSGASAMELLMVESPQGIHFVAFLKNKNDFEVLATFDRRALLPESPSRQLIEAGIMSFEQLDSVFKEGGQKIEQSAKELAATRGTSDQVFMELQRLMVQEKRRRRKFRQMIDYFVDKLDEMDLTEDLQDSPFVPKDLNSTNKEAETEQELSESDMEDDLYKHGLADKTDKNGFKLEPEDGEVH